MTAIAESVEKHHQLIILSLVFVIFVFLLACTLNDVIPICHWVFNCDHRFHAAALNDAATSLNTGQWIVGDCLL
jgi:hypothetical protein